MKDLLVYVAACQFYFQDTYIQHNNFAFKMQEITKKCKQSKYSHTQAYVLDSFISRRLP